MKNRPGISKNTCRLFTFLLPNKMKKQMQFICIERDIELAQYIREAIEKNNNKYKYLMKNII